MTVQQAEMFLTETQELYRNREATWLELHGAEQALKLAKANS